MPQFSHLHCHTQFSLLDGAASISGMYKKAVKDGMKGLAITDHGNMFGVFQFVAEAAKYNTEENPDTIKPIVGCEFYLVADRHRRTFTKDDKDQRFHQLFLAKNAVGYKNLVKLCSLGYIEGLYGKYPRIDKELVLKYHEGLIATTCCIGASVPKAILRNGEAEAEKEFLWWLDIFGEDYYVEMQRHDIPDQNKVNEVLLKFARKHNVKIICSNDSHYVNQEDSNAHDILLCINTGEKQATEKFKELGDDEVNAKGKRFAFYNDQFYFKTQTEMNALFSDLPEAADNTMEIVSKIEPLKLKRDIMLPHFQVPKEFASQDDYLHHLTFTGAKERYKEMTAEVEERINFELFTIKTMGFAGYFLIVADFIQAGKDIGVFVGPGRGSAAGSVVAYCTGITNIDPIKYNLLFERFLNPDRKSMPDIDTDFDDEGRDKVIKYVVEKYGKNQVAQIVTYGTMAAKMSIKDVARVLDLPLNLANDLAKLVPDRPGTNLNRIMTAPFDGAEGLKEKEGLDSADIDNIKKLREIQKGDSVEAAVLKEALILEGSVRGTGIHAAGIIIAPSDLTDILPIAIAKDSDWFVTQYEGGVIEDAGVIKMDFLGLKTLTIIRDALVLIKQNHGLELDINTLPLDDEKTFALYQRAETNATFQFESPGMQKYLRELKPDKFGDLIAMNALYRPGPMEYIPNFIARKHGREKVSYDLPEMEEYLQETYGITVYQEQVMLLSQKLANFSKGDADGLRKAMGKKQIAELNKKKARFLEGCKTNGHDEKICEKIWVDWEAFAQYAFNKSHSTCYALVAYQTAYLKAHYPAEYMAAVLSNNQGNIDKITFFMDESRRMGIPVKGPDVNESDVRFTVNKKGEVRYALSAIKGVGAAAVEELVRERVENGTYNSIFDLTKRVSQRALNKKSLEGLALAGAFDCFPNIFRAQYFTTDPKDNMTVLEKAVKYGNQYQSNTNANQSSLFGGSSDNNMTEPRIVPTEEWSLLEKLKKEKEVVGIYISGHPLDDYKLEIESFTNCKLNDVNTQKDKELKIAGIVTTTETKVAKNGNPYCKFSIEDYDGTYQFSVFGSDYLEHKKFIETSGTSLFIIGKFQKWINKTDQKEREEFKINKIELLSDAVEKLAKKLTIEIPAADITASLMNDLEQLCNKHKGKLAIFFKTYDEAEGISLDLGSRKFAVELNIDLVKDLTRFPELRYRLN